MYQSSIKIDEMVAYPKRVFYNGTDAILKGQALCYDLDYGTATAIDGSRGNRVEKPSTTNNLFFAGVADRDYPARSEGQFITINTPGSVCEVSVLSVCTVASTRLTAIASTGGQGQFAEYGLPGRGSCVALRTTAVITGTTDLSIGIFASSLDGTATYTTATKTVTKTAAFANVPSGITSADGIYVVILAGTSSTTSIDQITPGRYLVASKTSDDAVVLVSSAGAADVDIAFVCTRGNPTVPVKLEGWGEGGTESGLVEWVSPDSANTGISLMVGGTTIIFGGVDIDVDCGGTLANGLYAGMLKRFTLKAAVTTAQFIVTVTTGATVDASQLSMTLGYSADTLALLEFSAAGETAILLWGGASWTAINWTATADLIQ